MHLKHVLGDMQTYCANLFHGRFPLDPVFGNPTLAQRCREGAIRPIIASAAKQSRAAFGHS
jgi:hypothetical protein